MTMTTKSTSRILEALYHNLPSNEGLAWMGGNPVSSVAYDPSLEPPPDPYSHGSDERGEGRAQP